MREPRMGDEQQLERRVLTFMGAYASVQSSIDTASEYYFKKTMPALGPRFMGDYLPRISDDVRAPYFLLMAKDLGYAGDLRAFNAVYNRAKATRDLVGHSEGLAVVWDKGDWRVAITRRSDYPKRKLNQIPALCGQVHSTDWLMTATGCRCMCGASLMKASCCPISSDLTGNLSSHRSLLWFP